MKTVKLIDVLFGGDHTPESLEQEPLRPAQALKTAFALLTRGNTAVASSLTECIADTRDYFSSRSEMLDRRGLQYSAEAEPWLWVIAAVEAAQSEGYLRDIAPDCSAEEFASAVKAVLDGAGIEFSPDKVAFDSHRNPAVWAEKFNEYAGQSGITLYFIDLYSEGPVMGAALIADYAEAAEAAAMAGVVVTSRPV